MINFLSLFSVCLQQTQPSIPTRRQLTPVQQSHILSDIQQHQHRFAAHQNQVFDGQSKNFGQKPPPSILVEPSIQSQLPTQTSIVPIGPNNQYFLNQPGVNFRGGPVQHHTQTNFIPNFSNQQGQQVQFPQQPLFDRQTSQQQQVFQRSVQNQQFDAQQPFKPSQPLNNPVPTLLLPTSATPDQQQFGQHFGAPQPTTLQNQIFLQNQNRFSGEIIPQAQILQPTQQFVQNQAGPQQPLNSLAPPLLSSQQPQYQQAPQPPQFLQQQQPTFFPDARHEDQRLKELAEKQKLIQKHEQFVQRQYQKQQQKVRQLHDEFVQKQRKIKEQSIAKRPTSTYFPQATGNNNRGRHVSQFEANLFEKAVHTYQEASPTNVPPTNAAPTLNRAKGVRANLKGDISEEELEKLLHSHHEKIFNQLKQTDSSEKLNKSPKSKVKATATKALGREDLLKQLKLALVDQPQDLGNKTYSTMDLVLPDGQKVQVIRTTDPNLIQGATPLNGDSSILSQVVSDPQQLISSQSPPQRDLFEQVADGTILPPGSDFEVIKQSSNGELQSVGSLPGKKKVTFVYLEEQNDGSYKVQGVKANGDKEAKTKGEEVDSIIKRIKDGEIQLPPPSNQPQSVIAVSTTATPTRSSPSSTVAPTSRVSFSSSSPSPSRQLPSVTATPQILHFSNSVSPYSTLATISSEQTIRLTASPSSHYPTTTASSHEYRSTTPRSVFHSTRSVSTTAFPGSNSPILSAHTPSASPISASPLTASSNVATSASSALSQVFKTNGLHAMAKYLRQSGLDAILNETGPYTLFAPTDKAFKSLLVQLGGPDRAEEKFKSNPRLLSGVSGMLFLIEQ